MLETRPATVPSPEGPPPQEEQIPDEELEWEPNPLSRAVRSNRTFRFSVILLAILLGVGGYFLTRIFLNIPVQRADARRDDYRSALTAIEEVIPDLRSTAALVTDPDEPNPAEGLVTIVRLDDRAGDVHRFASEPLPDLPPFAPAAAVDELEPIRQRMLTIVDLSETIGERLGDTVAYRQAFGRTFRLPPLPLTASTAAIDQLADDIAAMIADTVDAAANLPDDQFFRAHREEVDGLIAWLTDWQISYLLALRTGDAGEAGSLAGQARDRIDSLQAGMVDPLQSAAAWSTNAVDDLERQVTDAILLAG